jgi:hypothetical protein
LPALRVAEVVEESGPGADRDVVERILDVNDKATGGAQCGADLIHLWHDLARITDLGDRAGRHEAVLQIDHDMGSTRRIKAIEDMQVAAALVRAPNDIGVNFRLMHAPAPLLIIPSCCDAAF